MIERSIREQATDTFLACQPIEGIIRIGRETARLVLDREAVAGVVEAVLEAGEDRGVASAVLDVREAVERVVDEVGGRSVGKCRAFAIAGGIVVVDGEAEIGIRDGFETIERVIGVDRRAARRLCRGDAKPLAGSGGRGKAAAPLGARSRSILRRRAVIRRNDFVSDFWM